MTETLIWYDPSNNTTTLTPLIDMQGYGFPPVKLGEVRSPLSIYGSIQQVVISARTLTIPILVRGANRPAYLTAFRALLKSLDPQKGDGRLRYTRSDSTVRELTCRYLSGLEGQKDSGVLAFQDFSVRFYAPDPVWYATSTNTVSFTPSGTARAFFPIFPLHLSKSAVFSSQTVTVAGDTQAWPVWTIAGPATSIALQNTTTGNYITLSTSIIAGDTLTIDTRPTKKTITKNGVNIFSNLGRDGSSLFPLESGENVIRVEMATTTGTTTASLSYTDGYWTP